MADVFVDTIANIAALLQAMYKSPKAKGRQVWVKTITAVAMCSLGTLLFQGLTDLIGSFEKLLGAILAPKEEKH